MNDMLIYNDTKSNVLHKIAAMIRWNNAEILNDKFGKARTEAAQKENTYLEYIASYIVDMPMPD